MREFFIIIIICLFPIFTFSQDLLELLDDKQKVDTIEYIEATFKGVRLINGHSIETCGKQNGVFIISHRFEKLNSGIHDFFGLDYSTIRLGIDYGVTNKLDIGLGRSNYEKMVDAFLKYKIFRQSKGLKNFPVTVTYLSSIAIKTIDWHDDTKEYTFAHRLYFTHGLYIARKFNPKFSLQLMPVFVHRNLVATGADENNVFSVGIGGRYKLTRRISVNSEYYYLLPGKTADDFSNSFSLGFDIETGGHVFQLHFTNSKSMQEKGFIPENNGKWTKGDVYFGFNILRYFSFHKYK